MFLQRKLFESDVLCGEQVDLEEGSITIISFRGGVAIGSFRSVSCMISMYFYWMV